MNTSGFSFDWNQVRAFLATAEGGSLSAAARSLGLTQPTVGRQVSALEESLGVVLFERIGRGLGLTPSGQELLGHVRKMGEAAERLALTATGQTTAVDGHVTITASDVFSVHYMPVVVEKLRVLAPGVTVDVVAANDIRDLRRREADIAVRHVRPDDPDLIARKLGDRVGHFCAAQKLLDRLGRMPRVDEAATLDFVAAQPLERFVADLEALGVKIDPTRIRVSSASGLVYWAMIRNGLGIGIMDGGLVEVTPGVERVFTELPAPRFPVWLTAHRELRSSPRIRLVYDALAEALADPIPVI